MRTSASTRSASSDPDLPRAQQLQLYRALAGCCREAAQAIELHAPPAPLWTALRRALMMAEAALLAA
jgi:hypothetical protein